MYCWSEAFEFCNPVRHSGEGGRHQEGTFDSLLYQVGNEGDALQGLSQAHLISEDTVHTIFVQGLQNEVKTTMSGISEYGRSFFLKVSEAKNVFMVPFPAHLEDYKTCSQETANPTTK